MDAEIEQFAATDTADDADRRSFIGPTRTEAAMSGVLGAAVALGVGELLSGLSSRIPSLVARVGDVVIDNVPGSIERWGIETFGSNDKPALLIGITVVALAIGAVTGLAATRRWSNGWIVYGIFALVGALAAAGDPQRSALAGWLVALAAAAAGLGTLRLLLRAGGSAGAGDSAGGNSRLGDSTATDSTVGDSAVGYQTVGDTRLAPGNRRSFVGAAGAATVVAVVAPVLGRTLRGRQTGAVEADRTDVASALDDLGPGSGSGSSDEAEVEGQNDEASEDAAAQVPDPRLADNFDDIDGVTPIIVANDEFYRIDTALVVPTIDVDTWLMRVAGMVDQELEFGFDDLLAMDPVEEHVTLSCVSNKVGGDLVGNARWLGVPITRLLAEAGVQPGATQIVGRSVDGWTGAFPTAYLDDPDRVALVAVAMNGEPLPLEHGFPVRLVVAGLYGYVSATKWLKEIELTTLEGFDGYWIPRGWSKLGPVKTQSRIDVPRANAPVPAGRQALAGVAWAPDRGVTKVEVRVSPIVDGDEVPGRWSEAELSADITDNSWRQWYLPWDAEAGDYAIQVRATDRDGHTQTDERTPVAPDGATGWHSIAVRVDQ